MNEMTPWDAKREMVGALDKVLRDWKDRDGQLIGQSVATLYKWPYTDHNAVNLVLMPTHQAQHVRRVVTIVLARFFETNALNFRVKMECCAWSTRAKGTLEAVEGWDLAKELARVALQTADALPLIVDEV